VFGEEKLILDLETFSKKDLEGLVRLLYGYYTAFVLDSPQ
jgi:hypothetical protein